MSEPANFERAVAMLQDAALGAARWRKASALMDEACGAVGNTLVVGDGMATGDVRIFFSRLCYRGIPRREVWREYLSDYHAVDERLPRLRRMPDCRLAHVRELYSREERKRSPCYNEMLLRAHSQNSINVRLDGPGGSRIVWVIHDPVDRDGWTSERLRSIRRLLPHLRQYVRVYHALAGADALGATLAGLLERTGTGIVELDRRGRIVAANDCARALLLRGDRLYDEDGLLFARAQRDNTELQRLLARALPPFGRRGVSGSMTVQRSKFSLPLMLHVTPVDRQDREHGSWPVAVLVLVSYPGSVNSIDPATVAAALGLTRMESRVAVMLAEGKSVGEIAESTGRKASTIRWHLQQIYQKHGISRQAELVRLVLSLTGPPGYR
ncbi:MAG: helix-turn-helix transcriptional regulator [Rhodospirillaceae bacterium]|nr:helix-turn-helix transcriptional regulator [Rhodospirillaceae bacterium]